MTTAFGRNIKRLRISRGMSVQQFAELVGVSFRYVYYLESGKRRNPSFAMVNLFASAVNLPADDLCSRELEWLQSNQNVEDNQ